MVSAQPSLVQKIGFCVATLLDACAQTEVCRAAPEGSDGQRYRTQSTSPHRTANRTRSVTLCTLSFSIIRPRWASTV